MTYNVHIFIVFICLWRSRVKEFMQFAQGRTIVHFKEVFYYSRFRKIFLKILIQILAIILYFRNCSCSSLRIISCNSYTREYLVFHEEGCSSQSVFIDQSSALHLSSDNGEFILSQSKANPFIMRILFSLHLFNDLNRIHFLLNLSWVF